jgi:hypothetical protein
MMMARGDRERGFVLVAVLWFTAILALVAVIIEGWVARGLDAATRLKEQGEARGEMISAQSEIGYLILINQLTYTGLAIAPNAAPGGITPVTVQELNAPAEVLAFDGRPYRFGDSVVRIQDDRGLYNIGFGGGGALSALLATYGVPYNDQSLLNQTLNQYIDEPGLANPIADRELYGSYGLPPPREAPLLTPWEPLRIVGWNRLRALWNGDDSLPFDTTVSTAVSLNPNTALPRVLRAYPGMDENAVESLLRYRQLKPITDTLSMLEATGVNDFDWINISFIPASSMHIEIDSPKDSRRHILALELTPNALEPYRIDYAVDLPNQHRADASQVSQLGLMPGYCEIPSRAAASLCRPADKDQAEP